MNSIKAKWVALVGGLTTACVYASLALPAGATAPTMEEVATSTVTDLRDQILTFLDTNLALVLGVVGGFIVIRLMFSLIKKAVKL